MSYLDAVSKKMQKNKIVKQTGEHSKPFLNNAQGSKDDLNTQQKAIVDKKTSMKQSKRLGQIRTAVRAGTEGPSSSVKNTNKKSPRYGQYYSIEAGKGGNYHVYKGGKRVFVRSRTGLSINKRKSTNAKQFNPKKGLHNKEYLIDA